ncbi:hypothetical protein ACFFRR_009120 [Megaselia abdita]
MEQGAPSPDGGNFQMPSVEQILEIIETMDMSPEEKADLKKSILEGPEGGFGNMVKDQVAQAVANSPTDYLIFVVMIAVIACVFALFGYKLYQTLVGREVKKQEKQKAKQEKKNKKKN